MLKRKYNENLVQFLFVVLMVMAIVAVATIAAYGQAKREQELYDKCNNGEPAACALLSRPVEYGHSTGYHHAYPHYRRH